MLRINDDSGAHTGSDPGSGSGPDTNADTDSDTDSDTNAATGPGGERHDQELRLLAANDYGRKKYEGRVDE
jgi:hypothetical protein